MRFCSTAILVFVLALTMSLFASAEQTIQSRFPTPYFNLVLPGNWINVPTKDSSLWLYRSEAGDEQISVTVLPFQKQTATGELPRNLQDYLAVRRKQEMASAPADSVQLTDTKIQSTAGGLAAVYAGYQPAAQRRFRCVTIANSKAIVSFYLEALDMDETIFASRAKQLLDTVQVVN